ncbi:hypothetical protein COP2_044834 [Malus domestica]
MGLFTGWGAGRAGSGSGSRAVGQVANRAASRYAGKDGGHTRRSTSSVARRWRGQQRGWETDAIQAEGDQRELTPQFGHLMLQFSGAGTLWLCL